MPVECDVEFGALNQDQFHAIDRVVTGHAFAIHNSLGRFYDESVYQAELAHRCSTSGFPTMREVPVKVTHDGFCKSYYLDMLVENAAIYELKAVEALNGHHQRQLINYLLLTRQKHGKLINFGSLSVECRFVSTRIEQEHSRQFLQDDKQWEESDDGSSWLRECFSELLVDWGCFLDASLYKEAMIFLMARHGATVQRVPVHVGSRIVGKKEVCLLDAGTAWHLSAISNHIDAHETHVLRLLNHMSLRRIQWINLNQQTVTFKTLKK